MHEGNADIIENGLEQGKRLFPRDPPPPAGNRGSLAPAGSLEKESPERDSQKPRSPGSNYWIAEELQDSG